MIGSDQRITGSDQRTIHRIAAAATLLLLLALLQLLLAAASLADHCLSFRLELWFNSIPILVLLVDD